MPLYSYECPRADCFGTQTELRKVEQRHDAPQCYCGEPMVLKVDPVKGFVKNPAVPKGSK